MIQDNTSLTAPPPGYDSVRTPSEDNGIAPTNSSCVRF